MDYTDKHVKCKVSIRGSFWTVFHNLQRRKVVHSLYENAGCTTLRRCKLRNTI